MLLNKKRNEVYAVHLVSGNPSNEKKILIANCRTEKELNEAIIKFKNDDYTRKQYKVENYEIKHFDKSSNSILIDFGDYSNFLKISLKPYVNPKSKYYPFKTAKEEREHREKSMLTVGKLIDWLKQFDKNALVCEFELNTGTWQSQVPENLVGLVNSVENNKKRIRKYDKRVFKSKDDMKKYIRETFKYVSNKDVCIRF